VREQPGADLAEALSGGCRRRQGRIGKPGEFQEGSELGRRIVNAVGLVADAERGKPQREEIADSLSRRLSSRACRRRVGDEGHAPLAQEGMQRLRLIQACGVAEVDHQQADIRRLQRARHPRDGVVGRDRGKVHELKVNVLVRPRAGRNTNAATSNGSHSRSHVIGAIV
jgi:hypothetical protein